MRSVRGGVVVLCPNAFVHSIKVIPNSGLHPLNEAGEDRAVVCCKIVLVVVVVLPRSFFCERIGRVIATAFVSCKRPFLFKSGCFIASNMACYLSDSVMSPGVSIDSRIEKGPKLRILFLVNGVPLE